MTKGIKSQQKEQDKQLSQKSLTELLTMAKNIHQKKQDKAQQKEEDIEIDLLISAVSAEPSTADEKPKAKRGSGKEKKVVVKETPKNDAPKKMKKV